MAPPRAPYTGGPASLVTSLVTGHGSLRGSYCSTSLVTSGSLVHRCTHGPLLHTDTEVPIGGVRGGGGFAWNSGSARVRTRACSPLAQACRRRRDALHLCRRGSREVTVVTRRVACLLIDHTRQVCLKECFNHKVPLAGVSQFIPDSCASGGRFPQGTFSFAQGTFSFACSFRMLIPCGSSPTVGAAMLFLSAAARGAHARLRA